ncbi:hypothetical protein N8T08_007887 [Aspergillus melleus]|uniref:Uncharacterized protein n=1 Tax=Aspergillus melleus TaxID=138277 RepID=A0ACC3AWP4_9EURO|nr:hypothetical protein N8T08_007887 [Aspergillus melleus]
MRFTILSTAAMALMTCASAAPIAPRSSSILLDWTKESAIKTVNSLMGQLPMKADVWKVDDDAGVVGVNFDLAMQDLAKTGLVTLENHQNAKIHMEVTIEGLD